MNANGLTGSNSILWIMGHSRGGALANILAARRIDLGYTVFGYTFAAPATTTVSKTVAENNYPSIFNIINEDDFVPQLPLSDWGFRRYGHDKPGSIEDDGYADDWDNLFTGSEQPCYSSSMSLMQNTLDALAGVASLRNDCYVYKTGIDAYHTVEGATASERNAVLNATIDEYPANTYGLYRYEIMDYATTHEAHIYQKPAFFMQLLAANMSKILTGADFLFFNVAPYLENAKTVLIIYATHNVVAEPHYTESYYLLSTKITN